MELSSDGGYIQGQTVDGYKTSILLKIKYLKLYQINVESFYRCGRPFCFYFHSSEHERNDDMNNTRVRRPRAQRAGILHRDFSIFGVQQLSTVVTAVDSAPPVDGYKSSAGSVDVTIVTSETHHLEPGCEALVCEE